MCWLYLELVYPMAKSICYGFSKYPMECAVNMRSAFWISVDLKVNVFNEPTPTASHHLQYVNWFHLINICTVNKVWKLFANKFFVEFAIKFVFKWMRYYGWWPEPPKQSSERRANPYEWVNIISLKLMTFFSIETAEFYLQLTRCQIKLMSI